jgi:hypothetical protein
MLTWIFMSVIVVCALGAELVLFLTATRTVGERFKRGASAHLLVLLIVAYMAVGVAMAGIFLSIAMAILHL